jgi:hypothetical protein
MGTNYYYERETCSECGNLEELHIGKNSCGWSFSFRGYDDIRSWQDWKKKIQEPFNNAWIYNEYGEEIKVPDFINLVEAVLEDDLNHTTEMKKESPDSCNGLWIDEDGYSFQDSEFS